MGMDTKEFTKYSKNYIKDKGRERLKNHYFMSHLKILNKQFTEFIHRVLRDGT